MKKIRKSITEIKDEIYDVLGGISGAVKYYKRHPSAFYPDYFKTPPQPLVQNSVTVNVKNDGEARRHLENAFYRVIDERQKGSEDPAVYVDGERLRDPVYVDGERLIEHQPAEPRPATPDAVVDAPDAVEHSDPKSPQQGPLSKPGGVATTPGETNPGGGQKPKSHYSVSIPGLAAGAALDESADNRSTTEKYLTWSGSGAAARTSPKDWGPV
jgi:hypothetical protein